MKTLTLTEIKEIEAKRNPYGCGADDCLSCYPLIYNCWACDTEYEQPRLNGQCFYCPECSHCENCGVA